MEQTRQTGPLGLRADVVATVLDEGALLLDLDSKYFFLLNHTAWSVVQLFEGGTTVAHVEAQCVPAGATRTEIDEIVTRLVEERLLEPVSKDAEPTLRLAGTWVQATIEKQDEPLQRVIVNAFDPTIPLAE